MNYHDWLQYNCSIGLPIGFPVQPVQATKAFEFVGFVAPGLWLRRPRGLLGAAGGGALAAALLELLVVSPLSPAPKRPEPTGAVADAARCAGETRSHGRWVAEVPLHRPIRCKPEIGI